MSDKADPDEFAPWEQLDTDTEASWAAFRLYRDQGGRRMFKAVAEALGISRASVVEHAQRHNFRARAKAWDQHVDRRRQEVFVKAQRQSVADNVRVSRKIRRIAEEALDALDALPKEQRVAYLLKDPKIITSWLAAAHKADELALGDPSKLYMSDLTGPLPGDPSEQPTDKYFDLLQRDKLLEAGQRALKVLERPTLIAERVAARKQSNPDDDDNDDDDSSTRPDGSQ